MWKNLSVYFGIFMVLFYFAAGLFVIFSSNYFLNFQFYQRILLGGMIIVYGVFRLYKVFKTAKQEYENEDEE